MKILSKIKVKCENCGKEIYRYKCEILKHVFCSRECSKTYTSKRMIEMNKELECCTICPHNCKINRTKNPGRCKSTDKIKIALYSIHNFEEPCISGEKGSGTIFFSNCNMNCIYCQNYEISQLGKGKEISVEELAEIMIEQQEKNVENINLVTPTSYAIHIKEAIEIANEEFGSLTNYTGMGGTDKLIGVASSEDDRCVFPDSEVEFDDCIERE